MADWGCGRACEWSYGLGQRAGGRAGWVVPEGGTYGVCYAECFAAAVPLRKAQRAECLAEGQGGYGVVTLGVLGHRSLFKEYTPERIHP